MIFKKLFFGFFSVFFLFFLYLFTESSFLSLFGLFSFSLEEKMLPFFFGLSLDKVGGVFLCMVCLVTSLVFLYSEFYMEYYKNKKFLLFTFSFFIFMAILSSSGSLMNSMIGWDGLGISSLMLIMFYPNKLTLFNSYLTFFFNRTGDVLFILFFCSYLSTLSSFPYLNFLNDPIFSMIFILCLMTKSAQIPFSSWLPAAMSAPTPISAMVHSSTLVTAGLFMFFKFLTFFWYFNFATLILYISAATFLLGGFLGVMELDLKKIVAFSTMSQISMILFFISAGAISLGLSHMFSHALFKTLLFTGCGVLFVLKNSDQTLKKMSGLQFSTSVFVLILASIFSMSGVPYSSSFFTKDLVLEIFLGESMALTFIILISGSILTIIYSGKILSSFMYNSPANFISLKSFQFYFIFVFAVMMCACMKAMGAICFNSLLPLVNWSSVILINLIISSSFFFYTSKHVFPMASMEILFMKTYFFSIGKNLVPSNFFSGSMTDLFFFKPSLLSGFSGKAYQMNKSSNKFWLLPLFVLISL